MGVSVDEQHIALPKLYGAPAYARPPAPVDASPRPLDPDDLPIEALQTDEERQLFETLPARAWQPGGGAYIGSPTSTGEAQPTPRARPFNLRTIAGKLLGN